jgi:protein subunit release factor A
MPTTNTKELLFSLSKAKGDFIVTTARSSGAGGQNVNKRDTKVVIRHPASGTMATSQTHRTQGANRRAAFQRLVALPEFLAWVKLEAARRGVPLAVQHERQTQRIRTYHEPRGTVVDHRTGATGRYCDVLNGKLEPLLVRSPLPESAK